MKLQGKVALITGASRGVGKACAELLSAEGAAVAVNYRTGRVEAEALVRALQAEGRRAVAIAADVSDSDQATRLVETCLAELGGLDILVNNAGIARDRLLFDAPPEEWLDVMRVNFGGVYNCTRAAIAQLAAQGGGVVVNVSSAMGERGWTGNSSYAASKGAVNAFTRAAAIELARFKIRVNAVLAGMIATGMASGLAEKDGGKGVLGQIPMRSFAAPEEIARAVLFLAGPDSSYMTGALVAVDGGVSSALGLGR